MVVPAAAAVGHRTQQPRPLPLVRHGLLAATVLGGASVVLVVANMASTPQTAKLDLPVATVYDELGRWFIQDQANQIIRMVDTDGDGMRDTCDPCPMDPDPGCMGGGD